MSLTSRLGIEPGTIGMDNVMLCCSMPQTLETESGLTIHTRTKIRYDYSFIETAAIKIGDDIFEISSWGKYFLNGVSQADTPAVISDYFITHDVINEFDHKFDIDLGQGANLVISSHKDIVSVGLSGSDGLDFEKWFKSSVGLMGAFETGEMLARDGVTVLNDPNAFGQECRSGTRKC